MTNILPAARPTVVRPVEARHPSVATWRRPYVAALVAADGVAIVAASLAAERLRFDELHTIGIAGTDVSYLAAAAASAPLWVATMAVCGVYDARCLGNGSEEYRRILNGALRFLAVVAIISMAAKLDLARAMVALAIPLATLLTVGSHLLARRSLHRRRGRGRCMHRVVVVGLEHQVADLVRHFRRARYAGMEVVGACIDGAAGVLDVDGDPVPLLGPPADVVGALRVAGADTVAVADQATLRDGALRRLGWDLEGTGVDLLVAPSVIDVAGPRIAVRPVAGLPLLHVAEPSLDGAARLVKEGLERVAAGLLLVLLAPLLAALAVAVRGSSRGPSLFAQQRVGQHGRPFTLYKFRTMVRTAETDLIDLADRNEHDGPLFKMRDDPRRTSLGRRLRRLSLDELPQLWNVLAGQMSIVGPRPPLPGEVEDFSDEARRRLLVKPGLTGLWQVSGRANLPWKEAVRLDLYYVENWSPALDLVILAKTVRAVIRGHGAY